MSVMDIFGLIMLLCMLQLLIIGSVIQRGKENWIPENMKKGIKNLPMYCRYFGNRIILLGLIAGVCSWISYKASGISVKPIIIFGIGILLTIILMVMDHKKFGR